jgi:hypothetical protein
MVSYSVFVWQAYNDGKNNIWECADSGARGGTQVEVECLKGYGDYNILGTTDVKRSVNWNQLIRPQSMDFT